MMERDTEQDQLDYAQALVDWGDVGGYEWETLWDVCTVSALGMPFEKAQWRKVSTLSGGEQKRVVLEALLRGPEEVLVLDEPDNYLDVPAKRWLEEQLIESPKTVLFVSHDRELLDRVATRIATLEPERRRQHAVGAPGPVLDLRRRRGPTATTSSRSCAGAGTRSTPRSRRSSSCTARRRPTTPTWRRGSRRPRPGCAKFEEAGPPEAVPLRQKVRMRLTGGRTAKRAVDRRAPRARVDGGADEALRPRDLVRRAGRRCSAATARASRTSCGSSRAGGSDPDASTSRWATSGRPRWRTRAGCGSARACGPAGSRRRTSTPRCTGRTLLEILHRGDEHRAGHAPRRGGPGARPLRPGASRASRPSTRCRAGSRRASRSCCSSCRGATCLLLDEPTDNLDLHSAEALEDGLAAFEGTVLAVTHDRWFARGFDRFLVFGADGRVYEADEPVWDEGRVERAR